MGLDWKTLSKPRAGHETEHRELYQVIRTKNPDEVERAEIFKRLAEIEIDAFETIGIPLCGKNKEATDYVIQHYEKCKDDIKETLEEYLAKCDGVAVLSVFNLEDASWGFPVYQGPFNSGRPDIFRAQFLASPECYEVLSNQLKQNIYESQFSDGLKRLGKDLESLGVKYAKKHKIFGMNKLSFKKPTIQREPGPDFSEAESIFHVIISASKWCEFWSNLGHGLSADY